MKVEVIGEGEPNHAVIYCIHGNETCGKKAVERFKQENIDLNESVKLIMANEEAYRSGERFIDADLNRVFSDSTERGTHEAEIASRLLREVEDLKVLDLHSTFSYPEPFGILANWNTEKEILARTTGVKNVVDISHVSGGFIGQVNGVCIECGLTGTEQAAKNAYEVLTNFLACNGVIDEECNTRDQSFFEIYGRVEGQGYEFLAENFEKVEKGEVFAKRDDEELKAEEGFYPVLMSTNGYDGMIGFKARKK